MDPKTNKLLWVFRNILISGIVNKKFILKNFDEVIDYITEDESEKNIKDFFKKLGTVDLGQEKNEKIKLCSVFWNIDHDTFLTSDFLDKIYDSDFTICKIFFKRIIDFINKIDISIVPLNSSVVKSDIITKTAENIKKLVQNPCCNKAVEYLFNELNRMLDNFRNKIISSDSWGFNLEVLCYKYRTFLYFRKIFFESFFNSVELDVALDFGIKFNKMGIPLITSFENSYYWTFSAFGRNKTLGTIFKVFENFANDSSPLIFCHETLESKKIYRRFFYKYFSNIVFKNIDDIVGNSDENIIEIKNVWDKKMYSICLPLIEEKNDICKLLYGYPDCSSIVETYYGKLVTKEFKKITTHFVEDF